ncbi:hypothetical protein B0H13DRAFT_2025603 [Mycena leptocephala]|nr:hypothetical protein B0H13DRAFT_2025603 [Mycena leptocephala]
MAQNSLVPLPEFIQSLTLANDPTPALIANVQSLQGLKRLKICLSDKELALHLDFLSAAFPCLQELTIDGAYNTSQPILDAVQAFPSITSLCIAGTLGDDFFDKPGPAGPPTCQFPPKLHTMFISPHDGTADGFFQLALVSEPIPLFSTLSANDTWPRMNSPMGKYLIHAGDRLRRLCIGFGRSTMATSEHMLPLRYCTDLVSFEIRVPDDPALRVLIDAVLPNLCTRRLTSLIIFDTNLPFGRDLGPKLLSSRQLWKEIGQVLSTERFVGLKAFEVRDLYSRERVVGLAALAAWADVP